MLKRKNNEIASELKLANKATAMVRYTIMMMATHTLI
jgi:hypothetical protein